MAALMIMAAGGCGSSNKEIPSSADNSRYISETKDNGNVTDGKEYDIDNGGLPYDEETVYNQLFDINNKVEIDVDISDDELAKMQSDYNRYDNMGSKSPIYRKCDLKISITSDGVKNTYIIRNTGIRMKGNTSRTAFYDSNSGVYSLIHFKVDFTESFDDEQYYGGDSDYDLDIDKMRLEAKSLLGTHDFKGFMSSGSSVKDTVRTIHNITIEESEDLIIIEVEGNGFLYNMVRIIVGTLVDIGRGRIDKSMEEIVASLDRGEAGHTAPAHGLFLKKVHY